MRANVKIKWNPVKPNETQWKPAKPGYNAATPNCLGNPSGYAVEVSKTWRNPLGQQKTLVPFPRARVNLTKPVWEKKNRQEPKTRTTTTGETETTRSTRGVAIAHRKMLFDDVATGCTRFLARRTVIDGASGRRFDVRNTTMAKVTGWGSRTSFAYKSSAVAPALPSVFSAMTQSRSRCIRLQVWCVIISTKSCFTIRLQAFSKSLWFSTNCTGFFRVFFYHIWLVYINTSRLTIQWLCFTEFILLFIGLSGWFALNLSIKLGLSVVIDQLLGFTEFYFALK